MSRFRQLRHVQQLPSLGAASSRASGPPATASTHSSASCNYNEPRTRLHSPIFRGVDGGKHGVSSGRYSRQQTSATTTRHAWTATSGVPTVDVVLSSGFLAFAAHSGFLQAVHDRGLSVRGCYGTSAGALTGALFSAGYAPSELAVVLSERPPLSYLAFNVEALYAGLFRLDGAIARLRQLLPATFEELPVRFACGVIDAQGRHVTVSSGPLPEAVAASMAIPCLFAAVDIPGRLVGGPYADGGQVDRVGLRPWRQLLESDGHRGDPAAPTICHVIERSSPFSGDDDVAAAVRAVGTQPPVLVVRSPKSGQSLTGLREFEPQFETARQRAGAILDAAREELTLVGV